MYCTIALNFVETVLLMTILTRGYGPTNRQTDRPTDIATYRAAITAKNNKIGLSWTTPDILLGHFSSCKSIELPQTIQYLRLP